VADQSHLRRPKSRSIVLWNSPRTVCISGAYWSSYTGRANDSTVTLSRVRKLRCVRGDDERRLWDCGANLIDISRTSYYMIAFDEAPDATKLPYDWARSVCHDARCTGRRTLRQIAARWRRAAWSTADNVSVTTELFLSLSTSDMDGPAIHRSQCVCLTGSDRRLCIGPTIDFTSPHSAVHANLRRPSTLMWRLLTTRYKEIAQSTRGVKATAAVVAIILRKLQNWT